MDGEDELYVCKLSAYSVDKARRELFEDPQQRLGAVQTLRAWVKAQPHFTSRVDTFFLVQVLRTAKFSQLRARELIENILTMRTRCPEYMVNIDTHEPGVLTFVEKGQIVHLPKADEEGRRVVLIRGGMLDLNDKMMSVANEMRSGLCAKELLQRDDENCVVNGVVVVFDMTGVTTKYLTRANLDTHKNTSKIHQDCSTGRVKAFHLYNAGALFEMMMGVMRPLMKKKYLERFHLHETLESLYKVIPMSFWPDEYLPDDYKGPSAGPIKALSEDLKRRLMAPEFRAHMLAITHERYKLDASKRDTTVVQESFRKLNVD